MAIYDKTTTNKWNIREVINHSTHIHLLNTIKSIITQTLENFARREFMASRLWQLVFLKHFKQNSSRLFVWNKNNRFHISYKNHVYKERKKTTHARIGERNIHQHIKKISTLYVNNRHKTHVQDINVSKVEKRKRYK